MCGRLKRKSDKQKVVRVFEVQANLEDTDFAPETICVHSPCSPSSTRTKWVSVRSR
ncbi:hypothetical protein BH10ACI4_BH10ACI4_02160 [soil metagenome]